MGGDLPREVAAILQRVTILSEQDQLVAYEAIREYLVAGGKSAPADAQLDERGHALRVMRAVMEHYRLSDPRKLQAKQFDEAPDEVREGWKHGRVIRAWAKWKFAQAALAGSRPRPTARQRAVKSKAGVAALRTSDYISGVRDWLSTDPPKLNVRHYDAWAQETNAAAPADVLPFPGYRSIRSALGLSWKSILSVARGEITVADVTKETVKKRIASSRGPHDLVSSLDIVTISGKSHATVQSWMHRENFPVPVLVIGRNRFWLRGDIKLFLAKKKLPNRTRNELDGLYVTRVGAAEILGVALDTVDRLKGRPEPAALVGQNRLWLTSEIEAFRDARRARAIARGRKPQA